MKIFGTIFLFLTTILVTAQTTSKYICVDQFGYRPSSDKVAVIRDPQVGWDASESFTPGTTYKVINISTGTSVFQGSPIAWNGGATNDQSGDRCWWFDFSSVTTPGSYYVLDVANNVKSYNFDINEDVYKIVLKTAVRMLFYQRLGCAKDAKYAGAAWADGIDHVGPLQDLNCRLYSDKNNAATEKDLHGGWTDAGDQNKYTSWTAGYCYVLAKAYTEKPDAWGDDYNIPESGNGMADVLDELKWGLDYLLRVQQSDGSCLSIVGLAGGSPPSSATGQSLYGPATTDASFCCANAFAMAAITFAGVPGMQTYSDQLKTASIKAWNWATANPNVIFHNNSSDIKYNSQGLGAGDQGVDDCTEDHIKASVSLLALTNGTEYKTYFESNYTLLPLWKWYGYVDQYRHEQQDYLMYYATLPNANQSIVADLKSKLVGGFNNTGNYIGAMKSSADPYRAFIHDYAWGSNAYKGSYGTQFYDMYLINLEPANSAAYKKNAEEYIHYIHGVNPLNLVYLTNMNSFGAENSATQIWHTWFSFDSPKWDQVGVSTYGPAPGYLPGGANQSYNRDACCSGSCSSQQGCSIDVSKAVGQPAMKSYMDDNSAWPVNTWSITEPSDGYQCDYIRLLSKFVTSIDTKCVYPTLGTDTSICGRSSINLNSKLTATGKSFKWYKDGILITGATSNTYSATSGGVYLVEVDSNGCKKTDEIKINASLSVNLGADVSLCNPATTTLDAGNSLVPNIKYFWSNNDTTQTTNISKAGIYYVTVSAQNCGVAKDTVVITSKLLNVNDTIICPTQTAALIVNGNSSYEWYSANIGGTLLATGKMYTASPSQTSIYYIKDVGGAQYSLGKTTVGTGDVWSMGSDYLSGTDKIMKFTAIQPLLLQSLAVYVSSAGDLTLNIVSGGTTIRTKTITGLSTGKQTVNLDLDIPTGDYLMTLTGSTVALMFEASGASFPYTIAGVATMTYNESWQSAWYGYFYDLKISVGNTCARTPVKVCIKDSCSTTQIINLKTGWNLISLNVHPADSSITTLFNGLNVQEIKNMDVFWHKGINNIFNGLTKLSIGDAYFVDMNTTGSLSVKGIPISKRSYSLKTGWNLVGCQYQINTALSTDFNATNCSIIKNFDGFWIPNGTTNSIQNFEPGKGYFLKGN